MRATMFADAEGSIHIIHPVYIEPVSVCVIGVQLKKKTFPNLTFSLPL